MGDALGQGSDESVAKWRYCAQIFVDFSKSRRLKEQKAAQLCFSQLARNCLACTGLYVQGWAASAKYGLAPLASGFPSLLHLELSDCDTISDYNVLLPVLRAHPQLKSLRCCFSPSQAATMDFADALP